jgi:6-phosphogluconate dehydrogenase
MQIGIIGLGRMGANIARRLMHGGHECVVYDLNSASVAQLASEGAIGATSMDDLVDRLKKPKIVWIMVPAGKPTEQCVSAVAQRAGDGAILIDGGNTYFKDDVRRSRELAEKGIHYIDIGTSGGIWGLERGYCLMIGGDRSLFDQLSPVFETLAPGKAGAPETPNRPANRGTADKGYLYCGPSGSGHYVKMIHNGIEYGLMQAYAEGFDILRNAGSQDLAAEYRYDLDVAEIAEVWRRGSVVGSWLLDLTASALAEDPHLASFSGFVQDSGEGRWALIAAIEQAVCADALATSLFARYRSRQDTTFSEKVLSAMRHKFGGHVELPTGG